MANSGLSVRRALRTYKYIRRIYSAEGSFNKIKFYCNSAVAGVRWGGALDKESGPRIETLTPTERAAFVLLTSTLLSITAIN